jgi:CHAT domain-containing protein
MRKDKLNEATEYAQRCMDMFTDLYPAAQYPQGHPALAQTLFTMGSLLADKGESAQALAAFERAFRICEQLYAPDRYPAGHPDLVKALLNYGGTLHTLGKAKLAFPTLLQAFEMHCRLLGEVLRSASEFEADSYIRDNRHISSLFISSAVAAGETQDLFGHIWLEQGAVSQMVRLRRAAIAGSADSGSRALNRELSEVRSRLANLLVAPAMRSDKNANAMRALSARKEELEREIAAKHAELGRGLLPAGSLKELEKCIGDRQVLVDILSYSEYPTGPEAMKGRAQTTLKFVAFVVRPGKPTATVLLGPDEPITRAINAWRGEIIRGTTGSSAEILRRLIWDKVEPLFPPGTETVYVVPDASMVWMPWSALPGRSPGTVLLEDYALAIVPSGPFLLDRLSAGARTSVGPHIVLAVGGVDYSACPEASVRFGRRAPIPETVRSEKTITWDPLPGTLHELEALRTLAGARTVRILSGPDATTAGVLRELQKARWAVLATHGFNTHPDIRPALGLDERAFQTYVEGFGQVLAAPGLRNPLVNSGIVLAGANLSVTSDGEGLPGDAGILTGEAIAGMDLSHLDLVVLSACETGLGVLASADGTFSLQRAFHAAGARNVVASLWKVDDEATAALMKLFFKKLWLESKPPIAALREAQLFVYHNPDSIRHVASARGLNFGTEKPVQPATPGRGGERAATKLWAAFVLSGVGSEPSS